MSDASTKDDGFQELTDSAKPQSVGSIKEYIEHIEKEFGGLRAAGEALHIDWQRLQYWKKSGEKLQKFLDFLESSRSKAKMSKSAMWDKVVTRKKGESKTKGK